MSLVLDIDGTGIDRSKYRTNMSKVGKVILGGRPKYDGSTGHLRNATPDWRSGDSQGAILAWINVGGAGTRRTIFATADEGAGFNSFGLEVANTDKLGVLTYDGASNGIQSTVSVSTGRSVFVGVVSNGLAWIFYIDGVAVASSVWFGVNNGNWFADIANRDSLTIGAARGSASGSNYLDGMVDELKVYDEALAADWIKAYYEQSRQHRLSA